MSDSLHGIVLAVRPIVHRIDFPFRTGAVMRRFVQNAVHHRVAHVYIGMRHIDFGAQNTRTVGKFAILHAFEQIEIFFHAALSVG